MVPRDPAILLSFVNAKLRDYYDSLEELCAALDADQSSVTASLAAIDYYYDPARNQFI
ncbi:DUF4250 domain-containing protein [Oscillibacter sp. MSJ-2]|uniref:DUF4250 domain-containing protein n=1 Tax=Dysosmobacter acutus TaxID=2841504 RepID=A0ABS6FAK4_9FIRM|nr:DUF4250 domain-containing protein [Dysosmobacter acutus]MBU5627316.1 DUF4250 domain-containing protein [Dysosmobacter acutus]